MKRYFCLLSLLITCTGFLSAEAIQIGDYYYNLNDANKTAEFTRKFSDTYKYVSTVEIPSSVVYNGSTYKVTRIADWTFSGSTGLTSVTIPNSVTRIGEWAFHQCTNLKSVNIPNSVTSLGEYAFYECSNLTSITIPNSVTTIGKCAFYTCSKLTSITIPNSVTTIGEHAFSGCSGLTSITISNSVTTISESAFSGCSGLTSITISNSVTTISEHAFNGCTSLTALTIPNSVTRIGKSAFSGCTGLKSVTISKNVNAIDNFAFSSCSNISSIVWKAERCSVATYIGVFDGENVTSFTFGNDVKEIPNHICSNMKKLTEVVIPEGVTTIGKYAFYGCSSLTSITIPNSVTTISEHVFRGCTSLTSVTISNSVTSIGESTFSGCSSLKSINIPNTVISIGKWAFSGCTDLTSFNVSPENMNYSSWDGVLYNKDHTILYAYPNKKSTSYVIPDGITTIGCAAFSGCTDLTSITIPNSVTTISEYAFSRCTGLKSINIPNSVTRIEKNAFYECEDLWVYTAANVSIPDVSYDHIKKVTPQELLMHNPFPAYAKNYVEKHINQWQQRGEFERTAEWQARVNEETRQQKINELLAEAERKYTDYYKQSTSLSLTLGRYDADNEVFVITDTKYGNIYMAVPYKEAQKFKENWYNKNVSYELQIKDGEIGLASVSILMPKGKQYTYRNTDAVTYNLEELDYDFAPINLNFAQTSPQNQQNASPAKRKAVKSLVDTDIPETGESNPNTFVIIFANEDYKNVASVPFAKNDGSVFQKYCQRTLGIPVSNIQYVENASYNDIRIKLAWLNDVCDAYNGQASVIVYYAGHGIPDPSNKAPYLLPVDGDGRYVQSAYSLDDFYQKLGAMNAKTVAVFMDACFSGTKREEGMLVAARGVAIQVKNGQPQGNMVVFSAATGEEAAYPDAEEGHGMFTYYLLKKLQQTKGDVTLQALGEYICTNVRQQSIVKNGKLQTPTVLNSPSATDWQNWKLK